MSTLLVRNLDPGLVEALKARSAANHRSMEAEARVILADAVQPKEPSGLGSRIRARFADVDWVEIPRNTDSPRAADFGA
ncbi:hypothetical protein BH09ACT1_BH09ACT1_13480 [soil metagenome]